MALRLWLERARRFARTVRLAYREGGFLRAASFMLGLLLALARHPFVLLGDYRLDRRLGIETRGQTRLAAKTAAAAAHHDSVDYQATPGGAFGRLLRSLPIDTPADYTFIDLGCGKGRLLVLAAMHGFGRVIGVELDEHLMGLARANIRAFKKRTGDPTSRIKLVLEDAARYRFPPDPTVVYLHNPFGPETLRDVAANILESWQSTPRPLVVAYYNPVHDEIFREHPVLRSVSSAEESWALYVAESRPTV